MARTEPLWEVLVPSDTHFGQFTDWQKRVCDIAGGLTITNHVVSGVWQNPLNGGLVSEPLRVVRVACSLLVMLKVAEATREHYDQHSVAYYRVSDEFRRTVWDKGSL